jgi:hypothetical protein
MPPIPDDQLTEQATKYSDRHTAAQRDSEPTPHGEGMQSRRRALPAPAAGPRTLTVAGVTQHYGWRRTNIEIDCELIDFVEDGLLDLGVRPRDRDRHGPARPRPCAPHRGGLWPHRATVSWVGVQSSMSHRRGSKRPQRTGSIPAARAAPGLRGSMTAPCNCVMGGTVQRPTMGTGRLSGRGPRSSERCHYSMRTFLLKS